jgi:hypothetical protein
MATLCASIACGPANNPPASGCPDDLPKSCPSPIPSYGAAVAPFIASKCIACHTPRGMASTWQFQTYQETQSPGLLPDIESMVFTCTMPPASQPQPTPAERQALLGWIVCGAPDN